MNTFYYISFIANTLALFEHRFKYIDNLKITDEQCSFKVKYYDDFLVKELEKLIEPLDYSVYQTKSDNELNILVTITYPK